MNTISKEMHPPPPHEASFPHPLFSTIDPLHGGMPIRTIVIPPSRVMFSSFLLKGVITMTKVHSSPKPSVEVRVQRWVNRLFRRNKRRVEAGPRYFLEPARLEAPEGQGQGYLFQNGEYYRSIDCEHIASSRCIAPKHGAVPLATAKKGW